VFPESLKMPFGVFGLFTFCENVQETLPEICKFTKSRKKPCDFFENVLQ